MIHQILIGHRDSGDYFRFSIDSTEAPQDTSLRTSNSIPTMSTGVHKMNQGETKKGTRVTPVGTLISCGYFGTKIGYQMRFEKSDYRLKGVLDSIPDERHDCYWIN